MHDLQSLPDNIIYSFLPPVVVRPWKKDMRALAICRHWRHIVLKHPSYARAIEVDCAMSTGHLNLAMQRIDYARHHALQFELTVHARGATRQPTTLRQSTNLRDVILQCIHRISHLLVSLSILGIEAPFATAVLQLLVRPMPVLKRLHLAAQPGVQTQYGALPIPHNLFAFHAPKLRVLVLENFGRFHDTKGSVQPHVPLFGQIEDLHLSYNPPIVHDIDWHNWFPNVRHLRFTSKEAPSFAYANETQLLLQRVDIWTVETGRMRPLSNLDVLSHVPTVCVGNNVRDDVVDSFLGHLATIIVHPLKLKMVGDGRGSLKALADVELTTLGPTAPNSRTRIIRETLATWSSTPPHPLFNKLSQIAEIEAPFALFSLVSRGLFANSELPQLERLMLTLDTPPNEPVFSGCVPRYRRDSTRIKCPLLKVIELHDLGRFCSPRTASKEEFEQLLTRVLDCTATPEINAVNVLLV